jgi:hypothetical protein
LIVPQGPHPEEIFLCIDAGVWGLCGDYNLYGVVKCKPPKLLKLFNAF